ncbi:hypothetical protein BGX34_004029, partial [Mortierella sp. NVP85]
TQATLVSDVHKTNIHLQKPTGVVPQLYQDQQPNTVDYQIEISRRMAPAKDHINSYEQRTPEGYLFDTENLQIFQLAEEGVMEERREDDEVAQLAEEEIKNTQFAELVDRSRSNDLTDQVGESVRADYQLAFRETTYAGSSRAANNDRESPPPANPTEATDTGQWHDFRGDGDFDDTLEDEYSESIFAYMKTRETELAPDRGYIENTHPYVWEWRLKAVDKMARICAKLLMVNEVFHLAVHFLDRIIPRIDPRKAQLAPDLGIACVLVACKYEDRRMNMTVSRYHEYLLLIGYQVDYEDLQATERGVLRILNYDLGWPGPLSFLRRDTRADGSEAFARLVAKYILEIMTYGERFLAYKPSLQAAGALYIGRRMRTGLKDWPSVFVEESGYTLDDLRSVVLNIIQFLSIDLRTTYVFRKYTKNEWLRVSWLTSKWAREGFVDSYPYMAIYTRI